MFPSDIPGLEALVRRTFPAPLAVEALAGDVGRRRYFRLTLPDDRTALGVVYPAEEEDSRLRWVAARERLNGRVRVPALIADDGRGNQIVEDFGRQDLAARFTGAPGEREAWLGRAADAAAAIAETPDPGINKPFDAALFRRELDLAREAVFDLLLESPLTETERAAHDAWADALVAEVLSHPRALCHRDYHGNNLFPVGEDTAVIDFQDLRSRSGQLRHGLPPVGAHDSGVDVGGDGARRRRPASPRSAAWTPRPSPDGSSGCSSRGPGRSAARSRGRSCAAKAISTAATCRESWLWWPGFSREAPREAASERS